MINKNNKFNPILITNPINIRYLTGFAGVSPEEREAYALMTGKKTQLFVSPLYREEGSRLGAKEFSRDNPIERQLAELLSPGTHLEFEETDLTVSEYEKLKKALPGIALVGTTNTIETQRMIKDKKELENIRLAAKIADQCFKFVIGRIKAGITEARLAMEIEGYLRFQAGGLSFSPIVAFNEHSAQPHYQARSHNPLRKGSLVLLDFGARVNGYASDMTRVVFFGTPNDEWVAAYRTVLAAQEKALRYLKTGRSGAKADAVAREVITKAGLPPYPHGLGHGVGLAIHEDPRLSMKKDATLAEGMVVTVEPGVYKEGAYGIRIEDLILLKHNGIELLSKANKELMIL